MENLQTNQRNSQLESNNDLITAPYNLPLFPEEFEGYFSKTSPIRSKVKPFLKWAGGKGQLISEIEKYYPFSPGIIDKYIEPFVGGGAVLFDILNKFDLREVFINDLNTDLINTYRVIRDDVEELIQNLKTIENEFLPLEAGQRKTYYYQMRDQFNQVKQCKDESPNTTKASIMIFLNKTCFNGLYRVNKKGLFNVPMGDYKNPLICDEKNLLAVSKKLTKVSLLNGDYKKSIEFVDKNSFVYIDPPYRPLNRTAMFTSYTDDDFDDQKQIELADYAGQIDKIGAKFVVSNSDPKNENIDDNFFESIYTHFKIERIQASRMINSNSKSRGKISELLISNL